MILSRLKRLVGTSVKVLRARFVQWTKPLTSSLSLGALADLARSKPELVAENAPLRVPLIVLRRQVKRPAHELRNEFVEELSPDLMSESRAGRDAPLVRGGRNRGMESKKGRR